MKRIWQRDGAIAVVLATLTAASRISTLHRSVLDWDESVYFLIAQAWQHGALPYTTIWDNKPVGIYAIFAWFQMIFGDGVIAMRIATIACVSLLAFAVYKITLRLSGDIVAGLFAGVTLSIASVSNDGLSANTELFMALFTALAVWAALQEGPALLVGILLGCAFMIKYVAVFEAPVVMALYLSRTKVSRDALLLLVGAALPLAAVIVLYTAKGELSTWWVCSVASNFRRATVPLTQASMAYALKIEIIRWGGLYLAGLSAAVWLVWHRAWFLPVWLLAGLIGVVAAKSFYDHYFLQTLSVLCVLAGIWMARLPAWWLPRLSFAIAILLLPLAAGCYALIDANRPDVTARIAQDLIGQNIRSLYVFDDQPILYALTKMTPPTRYVLPSELVGTVLPQVAGVDGAAEVERIMATHPQFVVRRVTPLNNANALVYREITADLAAHYQLWHRYEGTDIYQASDQN